MYCSDYPPIEKAPPMQEALRASTKADLQFGNPAAIGEDSPLGPRLCVPGFHQVCPYRLLLMSG